MPDPALQLPKLHFITYDYTPAMVQEYGYDVKSPLEAAQYFLT